MKPEKDISTLEDIFNEALRQLREKGVEPTPYGKIVIHYGLPANSVKPEITLKL